MSASMRPRRARSSTSTTTTTDWNTSDDDNNNNNSDINKHSSSRDGDEEDEGLTYEKIMGIGTESEMDGTHHTSSIHPLGSSSFPRGMEDPNKKITSKEATKALSNRLSTFRKWLIEDAKATIHPQVCIVNGEATDGTKNAPVLILGTTALTAAQNQSVGRMGAIDGDNDRALYDRTMGCQVRAVREIKEGDVVMIIPKQAMITPDVVAASDAGKAILACCRPPPTFNNTSTTANGGEQKHNFWDAFENTTICESKFASKTGRNTNSGSQMLIKIQSERKRAAANLRQRLEQKRSSSLPPSYKLCDYGTVSTRAPLMAFLIHQRFYPSARPLVSSPSSVQQFDHIISENDGNALASATPVPWQPEEGHINSFAPFTRTFPSSISLPLCWKLSELSLLARCIPGSSILQEVATTSYHLVNEFVSLLGAGILERFPRTFPEGLITWDRWVWAAAVVASRALPAACYLDKVQHNDDQSSVENITRANKLQSPLDLWNELGVLVPLLDMLNHESETHQITWQPPVPESNNDMEDEAPHPPRAIAHKRIRKGSELYTSYGALSNNHLILQYGFAQMNNPEDNVRMGWGFMDAVGNVEQPHDTLWSMFVLEKVDKGSVFESNDSVAIKEWWSEDRIKLLELEAFPSNEDGIIDKLRSGRKLTITAYSDERYHEFLLIIAAIATIPPATLHQHRIAKEEDKKYKITITPKHLAILRNYLAFSLSRKLEKLLQNLEHGLSESFPELKLWDPSLAANKDDQDAKPSASSSGGNNDSLWEELYMKKWQEFFDVRAYASAMEVEKAYYAMGSDSCVLTLYDGQIRALQTSIAGIRDAEKFKSVVVKKFEDLEFIIGEVDDEEMKNVEDKAIAKPSAPSKEESAGATTSAATSKNRDSKNSSSNATTNSNGSNRSGSPRNRKRNRRGGGGGGGGSNNNSSNNSSSSGTAQSADRPPAIKLHIGNLSFATTPSDLYDYFSKIYGESNVLECNIPTERETGRSRGFGFVAMPQSVAEEVLRSERKFEINGRTLKVAKSNAAGSVSTTSTNRPTEAIPLVQSDRCATCGYRPKYCVCERPNLPRPAGDYPYAWDMAPPHPPLPHPAPPHPALPHPVPPPPRGDYPYGDRYYHPERGYDYRDYSDPYYSYYHHNGYGMPHDHPDRLRGPVPPDRLFDGRPLPPPPPPPPPGRNYEREDEWSRHGPPRNPRDDRFASPGAPASQHYGGGGGSSSRRDGDAPPKDGNGRSGRDESSAGGKRKADGGGADNKDDRSRSRDKSRRKRGGRRARSSSRSPSP